MKVVINPKFAALKGFMESVLERSYTPVEVYRERRNVVEEVWANGFHLVVKRFKKPLMFNRWVYTFLRPTKAKRSYKYSLRLLKMGFTVPEPVGYVEKKKWGIFHTGVYVCLYTDYKAIEEFGNPEFRNVENTAGLKLVGEFVKNFAAFAAKLHSAGVRHGDFNCTNILYKRDDAGKWDFAMIDVNRAKFHVKAWRQFADDISQLSNFNYYLMAAIIKEYAKMRNINVKRFTLHAVAHINKYEFISRLKDKILIPLGLRKKIK